MPTAVALVGALAWPLTVLFLCYLLRSELRSIGRAIEGRIQSETSEVSIGPSGLAITTKVEAITAQMESLEAGQAQYGDVIVQQLGSSTRSVDADTPNTLDRLADEYLAIDESDYRERVRLKDTYARRLGIAAIECHASRTALASSGNEAYTLALASVILFNPGPEDATTLLQAGVGVNRLHVQYYVSLALSKLISQRLLQPAQYASAKQLLARYRLKADGRLLRRLDDTAAQLEVYLQKF